ncbi:MAG TPA: hypothetical protein VFX73_01400 [Chitinophagaceae bacterium]|nr:hypothetical protein [Chitinophagaceae bacterium]
MKQIMIILTLLAVLDLQAQKKEIRLHGFSQGVSSGIRKSTVDEKGEMITEKKSGRKTLLLFLESPAGVKLNVTELWINGEKYRFEINPEKSPVLMNTGLSMPGQEEKALIPKTDHQINRIVPLEKMATTEKPKRKIVMKNPVVVFYTVNGKSCYRSLGKLEILPDMVNE